MNICEQYVKMIESKYSYLNPTIIIYGSNVYSMNSSDLDVCLIVETVTESLTNKIIEDTLQFHKEFNLRIDKEIPYHNKLVYTFDEIEKFLSFNPFWKNGKFCILDIKKTPEFLNSNTMKYRLMLNILTTDHLVYNDHRSTIEKYENKAWKIIIEAIYNAYEMTTLCEKTLLEHLYINPITGAKGEMYLGYKRNNIKKDIYLRSKLKEQVSKICFNSGEV